MRRNRNSPLLFNSILLGGCLLTSLDNLWIYGVFAELWVGFGKTLGREIVAENDR